MNDVPPMKTFIISAYRYVVARKRVKNVLFLFTLLLVCVCLHSFLPLRINATHQEISDSNNAAANMKSRSRICDEKIDPELLITFSKSQNGEDDFLMNKYFNNICDGTYLEIGALDGIRYSNSYLFYKGLGWRGVLIEPNTFSFSKLKKNRPTSDELFNNAVCSQARDVHVVNKRSNKGSGGSPVDGIYEFMSKSFLKKHYPDLDTKRMRKIKCKPLSLIIEESSFAKNEVIDFLSIDVEGAEFEVLKTLDFNKHQFGVIFYEADGSNPQKDSDMKTRLEMHGYPFQVYAKGSNWHINANFHYIYARQEQILQEK